jgi:hypothetical protein
MIAMGMMQPAVYQIVIMVAVWNKFMSTIFFMVTSASYRLTFIRIFPVYGKRAFFPFTIAFMMKMPIVYIINVVVMPDFRVPACNTVLMLVLFMCVSFTAHIKSLPEVL